MMARDIIERETTTDDLKKCGSNVTIMQNTGDDGRDRQQSGKKVKPGCRDHLFLSRNTIEGLTPFQ